MKYHLLLSYITLLLLVETVLGFSPAFGGRDGRARVSSDDAPFSVGSRPSITSLYSSSGDDASFSMAALQKRMDQVTQNDSILPLVVLDSMLPRQVLKINVNNDLLMRLVKTRLEEETPYFGMLGMARSMTGEPIHLTTGVQVEIVGKPQVTDDGLNLELRGGQRFRIKPDTVKNAGKGWTQAQVAFLDSDKEDKAEQDMDSLARAMSIAKEFTDPNVSMKENKSLKDMWIELAREKERAPGQIDQLLKDLGPIPSWEEPSECAFWIGALINPIPAMGVALEIRPRLLLAETPEERAQIALDGIWNSIQYMQGPRIAQIKE